MTDAGVNLDRTESRTSLSLLERVRGRDPAAWERLVALYGPLVYTWCRSSGLQPADAADVGQEVFAAVARGIATFRHDRPGDTFRGWLYTITRHKLCDRTVPPGGIGAGNNAGVAGLTQLPTEPLRDTEPDEVNQTRLLYRRAVELVRGEFEPRTWEAFWRVCVAGEPAQEVAANLGITANAVYLAKSRILRRLHAEFAALLDFGSPAAL